jgi:hypothetical protein
MLPQSLPSFSTHQTRDDSAQSLTHTLTSIHVQPASAPLDGITSAPLEVLQAPSKASAPSIDPILLEKSAVLMEAEKRLERKRLEQSLNIGRDHQKDATALKLLPYLDVSDILGKAQQIEPHVSAFQPLQQVSNETSDSFDENSLYSSQNWSPKGPSGEPGTKDLNDGSDMMDISDEGEILESFNTGPALVNDATSSEHTSSRNERLLHPVGDYEPYVSALQPHPLHETEALQYADDEDEDDYSPPPPDSFAGSAAHLKNSGNQFKPPNLPQSSKGTHHKRGTASQPGYSKTTGQHNAGPSTRRRDDQGGANQRDRRSDKYSRRQSPDNSRNVLQYPKKRRRGADMDEHGLRSMGKRRVASPIARSPEPFIKSEPVSPPPFGLEPSIPTIPTKRPSRTVRALPEDIEIISPRIIRRRSDYQSEYDSAYDDYVSSANGYDTTIFRPPITSRRLQKDNEDLRRVASLQYARRPRSPALDVETYSSAGRLIAPASRSFSDHRPPPQIYQETVARPERVVRIVRSPPPPTHVADQPIFARLAEPAVMAPPARRPVVVDQYGNEYFDVQTQAAVRNSVAPPTRRVDVDPYYQRAATREPIFRQSLREAFAYDDTNDYQRMPPPQPRRTTKVTQSELVTEPRQRAYSLVPLQTTSPRNLEMLDAPSQQYDPARPATSMRDLRYTQQPTSSEYDSRTYSARPEPTARQEAPVYQNTPAISQPLATPLPQPDYVQRAYSHHPDSAPSQRVRGGGPAYHDRVPSGYQNSGVSAGQSQQAAYPPRAYSVAPNLASRYQENTEDMRNQYGTPNVPAFTSNYGSTPAPPTPQHGRPYVGDPGAMGVNPFGGRGNDVYAYL